MLCLDPEKMIESKDPAIKLFGQKILAEVMDVVEEERDKYLSESESEDEETTKVQLFYILSFV